MDAGVRYFEVEAGGQSLRLFRCDTHRADLTPSSCASRFKSAQELSKHDVSALSRCRYCPTGAAHADERLAYKPPRDCVRCGRHAYKLVRGLLCLSCYNRQLEVVKGRDRRGNPPHTEIYLWRPRPRDARAIPRVFPVIVRAGEKQLTIMAATFKEALLTADRTVCRGQPMSLEVLNAAQVGIQAARQHAGMTA